MSNEDPVRDAIHRNVRGPTPEVIADLRTIWFIPKIIETTTDRNTAEVGPHPPLFLGAIKTIPTATKASETGIARVIRSLRRRTAKITVQIALVLHIGTTMWAGARSMQ